MKTSTRRSSMENKTVAGYEYLLAYKITVPIYDYTVVFCDRWITKSSRTHDQMVQAARSGMQNIAEGFKEQGTKGYIKLSGVSRGSLEELLKDYHSFARQRNLSIWPKEKATNLMITLIHQANYLLDRLIPSLKERYRVKGGLTEELYRERKKYRGDRGDKGDKGGR